MTVVQILFRIAKESGIPFNRDYDSELFKLFRHYDVYALFEILNIFAVNRKAKEIINDSVIGKEANVLVLSTKKDLTVGVRIRDYEVYTHSIIYGDSLHCTHAVFLDRVVSIDGKKTDFATTWELKDNWMDNIKRYDI